MIQASNEKLSEKIQELVFDKILSRQENLSCADCSAKGPRWVSIDFGVFICMKCSGVHRMLGPCYTRVRSVKLDSWTKDNVEIMDNIGNRIANNYWEENLENSYSKPDANSTQNELVRFIQDKYVKRIFCTADKLDPVSKFLDCKKNGIDPKEKYSEIIEKKPNVPIVPISNDNQKVKPIKKPDTVNLMDFDDQFGDFQDSQLEPEFSEFHNAELTQTLNMQILENQKKNSHNLMDLYKEKPKEVPKTAPQMMNHIPTMMNNNMYMYNNQNIILMNGNMNNIQNNYGFNMQVPFHQNMNYQQHNIHKNDMNNASVKVKNGGDIMDLYNIKKTDTSLSGNEMQINGKGKQENIMGYYSASNFNVW